jgi:hypothetical protein
MQDKTDKFFKWVWRANALIVLTLALAALIGVTVLVADIGIFSSRDRPEERVAEVAGTRIEGSDLRFGAFNEVKGTQYLYAPLGTPSEYIGSGSSDGVANEQNLLFFDIDSRKTHWLFSGNAQAIQDRIFLMDPPECTAGRRYSECESEKKVMGILLEIQPSPDTKEKGQKLSRLAIASPDGKTIRELASDVDTLLGHHSPDASRTVIFYAKAGAVRVLDLDVPALAVRSDELLSADQR